MIGLSFEAERGVKWQQILMVHSQATQLSLDRATKVLTGTSVTLKWLPLQSQEETTMRATFATAVLVTASLMAAVALTSAQSIIGGGMRQPSQSKGLRGPAFAV